MFVGVPVVAVLLCCLVGILLLYRRRANRLNRQFTELEAKEMTRAPPRPPPPPQELWSPLEKEYSEIEAKEKPVEMWAQF